MNVLDDCGCCEETEGGMWGSLMASGAKARECRARTIVVDYRLEDMAILSDRSRDRNMKQMKSDFPVLLLEINIFLKRWVQTLVHQFNKILGDGDLWDETSSSKRHFFTFASIFILPLNFRNKITAKRFICFMLVGTIRRPSMKNSWNESKGVCLIPSVFGVFFGELICILI